MIKLDMIELGMITLERVRVVPTMKRWWKKC